ncbi:MAG: GMC family oxidoreductase [Acidobacteriota bacterium]|nr:GMC family oxidoreductase [Acidobacteriota bacterium]
MRRLPEKDVAVVGLGAAGGVAVLPLAEAGLQVVGLEAGTRLTARDFSPDEIRNNVRAWPFASQKANREIPTVRATSRHPTSRGSTHPMMNGVGGTSLHYWAQSWRLNPWDFKTVSETTRRYGARRIPDGSTVEDWPFGYDELEPWYDKVEWEVGISGQAGNVAGSIHPTGNRFEGPRKRDYPMKALRWNGFLEHMADAARGLGWNPFPGPAAINSEPYQGRSGCRYHGFCDRGGCHVDAKNSTAVTTIPRAEQTGNLEIITRAVATAIEVGGEGRASGVRFIQDGEEYFQPAKSVLLASYTYENVRLLLLSKSRLFPNGLANNHSQVGRHYLSHHQHAPVSALFPFDMHAWYGLPAQGVAIDDWADDNFDHGGLDFVGGGNLWVMSDRKPIQAANMSTFGRVPSWGSAWKAYVKNNADRFHYTYIQRTTLPYESNRLDLDPTSRDPYGLPVIRVTAQFKDNEKAISDFVQDRMVEWYRAAGAVEVQKGGEPNAMPVSTHAYGGTRMGDNPETNVVDRWGFSHEVPNLGVLGASVMGTSGAHNPTLTAQALAWRTADRLAESWSAIAG